MKRPSRRFWAAAFTFLFLTGCLVLTVLAVGRSSLFTRSGPVGPVISWSGLPAPRIVHPDWTSIAAGTPVNDLALHDGLLWAATSGGVVVWEWPLTGALPAQFRSEHGLAANETRAVAVGLDGRLWAATSSGISSYDGTDWETFTSADGLLSNDIRDLAVTPDGRLWAATAGGVNMYDGRRWRAFDDARSLLQLPDTDVTTLTVDGDGALLAGTRQGIARYDGRWQEISPAGSTSALDVRAVTAAGGAIWAATAGGLQRYDGQTWQLFTTGDGLADDDLRYLAAGPAGELWIAYTDQPGYLSRVNHNSGGSLTITTLTPADGLPAASFQTALFQEGGLRLLGGAHGVAAQNAAGGWSLLPAANDFPLNLISEIALAGGTLFAAGPPGVAQQTGAGWQLTTFPQGRVTQLTTGVDDRPAVAFATPGAGVVQFRDNGWQELRCPITGPPSAFVRGGVIGGDGAVWFATTAGVARYDGAAWTIFGTAQGLPSATVQTIAADPAGHIWVGTPAGLAIYTDRWQTVNGADVRLLAIGPDGRVWFITADEIVLVEKESNRAIDNPPVSQVYDIAAAGAGLWLAAEEGLFLFDGAEWVQRSSRRTTALAAGDGRLWAAQQGVQISDSHPLYGSYELGENLLTLVAGSEMRSSLLPTAVGLPHPTITALRQADDGTLWAASIGGIARFDENGWRMSGAADGLPSPVVYDFALSGSRAWAVTKAGIATFDGQTWRAVPELNGIWPFFEDVTIAAGGDGRIWLGAGDVVHVWQSGSWQPAPLQLPAGIELRFLTADQQGEIRALAAESAGSRLFIGRLDEESWSWTAVSPPDGLAQGGAALFRAGPDGRLWLGNAAGLWYVDPQDDRVLQPAEQQVRGVSALTFDAAGQPVAASYARGQLFFPGSNDPPLTIPNAGEQLHLYALEAGADGSIWIGGDKGVARLAPGGGWELYPLDEREVTQLISELAVGPDGALWIGTFAGEVWGTRGDGELNTYPDNIAPPNVPVSVLIPTAEGAVWKGSFGASLTRLFERRWSRFPHTTDLFRARVRDLAVGVDGTVWLGSDEGLLSLEIEGDTARCAFDSSGNDLLGSQLTTDTQGNLWVYDEPILWRGNDAEFTRAATLVRPVTAVAPDGAFWVAGDGRLLRIVGDQQQPLSTEGLPGEVTALAIGRDGTVYAGTAAGLGVYSSGGWQLITAADGLPGSRIRQLLVGADGRLHLLTEGGIGVGRP